MAGGDKFLKGLKDRQKQLEKAQSLKLEVGFFRGSKYEAGESVPEIAFVNEFGSPENNQPPRPFFRNAIKQNKDKWVEYVRKSLANGNSMEATFEALGQNIKTDIQESITNLHEPPLSSATIAKKMKTSPQFATKPLIETETMRNAVAYKVTNNGN